MTNISFKTLTDAIVFCATNPSKLIVLFAKTKQFKDKFEDIPSNLIICSSEASINNTGRNIDNLVGFIVASNITQVIPISNTPMLMANELETAYINVKHNKNACLFLLCDGGVEHEEMLLSSLYFIENDFKIIGGTAADPIDNETYIFFGPTRVSNLAIFIDIKENTQLIKENLYISTNKQLLVTHSDPISRTVYTFNNKPAAVEYAKQLDISINELGDKFLSNPLGKNINNQTYIASPKKINSDMSITFYSQIIPNTFIDILELKNLNKTLLETRNLIENKPKFLFSIHCVLRDTYLNQTNQWPLIIDNLNKINTNQTGFVSYGEQLLNQHLNQTMTLLVIG